MQTPDLKVDKTANVAHIIILSCHPVLEDFLVVIGERIDLAQGQLKTPSC
jgi:hypothetical protein